MEKKKDRGRSVAGLVAAATVGSAAVGLVAACLPFVLPAFRRVCLPFVPATDAQVRNVLRLLRHRHRTTGGLVDLGSGDGRIVLAAAKQGFAACGVELNPWLVLFSKAKALSMGLHKKAVFQRKDIWKTDLRQFENVVIFGVEQMMPQLEAKLCKELNQHACVIACRFPLPTWKEVSSVGSGIDTVWLYKRPESQFVSNDVPPTQR